MTQLQQAGRRVTVVTSALVAAIVSAAITISALLIVPALTAMPFPDSVDTARMDRAVDAGRAWQRQRLIESPAYYEGLHAAEQAGLEWELRYELTNPFDTERQRMLDSGSEWTVKHQAMKDGAR
ncbi:MAG TPA: hypothetical protein VLA76_07240 [Candidatus Angelobacter sp.]|nr:hypothetical protein [Candidatus Angelobacter sp.]